jgi:hypothetical protein
LDKGPVCNYSEQHNLRRGCLHCRHRHGTRNL